MDVKRWQVLITPESGTGGESPTPILWKTQARADDYAELCRTHLRHKARVVEVTAPEDKKRTENTVWPR